jgi:hypothetical protein
MARSIPMLTAARHVLIFSAYVFCFGTIVAQGLRLENYGIMQVIRYGLIPAFILRFVLR